MASFNALKQWQGQWQSTSLLEQTQPLQVPLESDIFLKPKVVADVAPPTLGINFRQIMWDMSYGRANLSSATRHKSSTPQTGILPHKWGLFRLHCRAGAAQPFSANESLRKERPRSGDPPRSCLRVCTSPSSQGNEFIWYQKHHQQPPLIQHFCCHPEQQQSHLSVHLGWGRVWRRFLGMDLFWHATKAKSNPIPRPDRFFLLLCQLLLLCLKILPRHCDRLWLNIKQPALGYCEQGDKSPNHMKSHSWSWPTASGTEIYKNALLKKKINCSPGTRSVQAEAKM